MSNLTPGYEWQNAEQQLPKLIEEYTQKLIDLINRVELLYPYAQPASESKQAYEADLKRYQEALDFLNTNAFSELRGK